MKFYINLFPPILIFTPSIVSAIPTSRPLLHINWLLASPPDSFLVTPSTSWVSLSRSCHWQNYHLITRHLRRVRLPSCSGYPIQYIFVTFASCRRLWFAPSLCSISSSAHPAIGIPDSAFSPPMGSTTTVAPPITNHPMITRGKARISKPHIQIIQHGISARLIKCYFIKQQTT